MQTEHLWRNLSTGAMSAEFHGGYQQQDFNQQLSASFNHDLFASSSVSIIKHQKFSKVSPEEMVQRAYTVYSWIPQPIIREQAVC